MRTQVSDMDDFGYSFHKRERDWPLFDSVPEECRCILKPSLVTSEDSDLSDDPDKILPSRHKRSKRLNISKRQSLDNTPPAKKIDKALEKAMFQSRANPALDGPFPQEDNHALQTSEEVLSAGEDDLEVEFVNQFLMATGHMMSSGNTSSSQQCFLIPGKEFHSSRSQQCLLISAPESVHATHQANSVDRTTIKQIQDENACAPSTLASYAENVLDSGYYENCIERAKGDHLDAGFGYTQDTQLCRKEPKAHPELWGGTRVQGQPRQVRQAADRSGGQNQSAFEEATNTQTSVTISKNSPFPASTEHSTHLDLMPAAEGKHTEDYSLTVAESYEYFYEDFGEEEAGDDLFFLRVPSVFKLAKRGCCDPRKINLLTIIQSLVRKYLHPTKQGQTAMVSARNLNTSENTEVAGSSDLGALNNALVKYSESDGSQTMMESTIQRGRGHSCLSCTPKDLCLFCFACASWAMKSATSQSDMWKAALLVNIGAISAVRYFRTRTKRKNSKYLALQDS
ncbi:hypothetical protein scyTo_0006608 [Scyliorhinus torazame]|uniref:Uncharacterized protein n=1 Tax=Scyliorhinus torazame TaxID=75743 RepID=A0A401PIY9_SCYTO|nr:hypothetical protein [Scyliorhinus torazame]